MRLRTGLMSLSGVVLSLLSNFTQATSFDCAKASTFAESQICNTPLLQRLDERLNSVYHEALAAAQDKSLFRSEQHAWLKERDACTTPACVSETMENRLQEIQPAVILKEPTRAQSKPAAPVIPLTPARPVSGSRGDLAEQTTGQPHQGGTQVSGAQSQPQALTATPPLATGKDPHALRPLKITLLVMGVLLLMCIWLHSRGSMVIYSCYTDALWTTMTPFFACAAYFTCLWLELPTQTAQISAAVVFGLMLLQVIIQTFRHNGFSIFFLLALYAKLLLFTIYFLSMAVLIFGGARTAAQRRRQRNLALGGSALFALLTGWMTRNRSFSHIDDYLAGRT